MNSKIRSKFTAKLLAAALGIVSVFILGDSVTDPVNATKLFVLGGFSFALVGSLVHSASIDSFKQVKIPLLAVIGFFVISLIVLFQSKAPFSQSLYGTYGRNNGFILYLCLSLLFIASLSLVLKRDFLYVIYALMFAGIVNVVYGLWVMAFGDFLPWENQYGNLLGTFGNPNFIGAFFGMFSSVLFAAVFSRDLDKRMRLGAIILLPIVFLTIMDTKAVQGKILFIASGGIALFFYVRDRFNSNYWSIAYISASATIFLAAVLGTLQKGPFASLLYKETVSLRGEYWYSGWQTGKDNPWFGVGFDSLGDWYRRSRRESALTFPGVDTVINAAHNVYMDFFAFGGWPLLLVYSSISLIVLFSIVNFICHNKEFDFIFVTLVGVWVCYQLQSIISINQIGLAIWGWATAGLIIAYTNLNPNLDTGTPRGESKVSRNTATSGEIVSPKLFAGIFAIAGFLITVPPLSADMKWRDAQLSQDVVKVEAILQPSYMNPLTTYKILNVVGVFETNGFKDLAHKYALEATKFNPNSYEAWRAITMLSNSTEQEKSEALAQMKRLDPLNPNLRDFTK